MLNTTYKCDSCSREFNAEEYFKYSAKCPDCGSVLAMNTGLHNIHSGYENNKQSLNDQIEKEHESIQDTDKDNHQYKEPSKKNSLNEKYGDYFSSSKLNTEQKIANKAPLNDIDLYDENKKREIVLAKILLPAKNLITAPEVARIMSSIPANISLEYFVKGAERSMLIRGGRAAISYITGIITTHYPAASVVILDDDPTIITKTDGIRKVNTVTTYKFKKDDYFPLMPFDYKQRDPVINILSGLHGLDDNESVLIQIKLLDKKRPEWLDTILYRIKAESQKGFITNTGMEQLTNETSVYVTNSISNAPNLKRAVVNMLLVVFVPFVFIFAFLKMFIPALICLVFSVALFLVRTTFKTLQDEQWNTSDLDIIFDKVNSQELFNAVAVNIITSAANESASYDLLTRINLILNQYSQSGGNSIIPKEARVVPCYSPVEYNDDSDNAFMYFSNIELASMWHIPYIEEDSLAPGLIAVRGVEMRLPEMADVAGFYKIGEFQQPGGRKIPVNLNKKMLKHNMFLIGKPGTGKTTMMEHLAAASFRDGGEDAAIIVIDPHGDMFKRLTGMVPKERIKDVVLLDFGDPDYVVSYNPLDVKTNKHTVDEATHIIVDIGKSLWSSSWGPRMQIPLQRTVTAIAAHNANSGQTYMDGLSMLGPFLTTSDKNRENYIKEIEDDHYQKMLLRYFSGDFKSYNANMREQIIMPVLSKAYRFEETPALEFFSPAETKFDPGDIIRNKKILLVNTRMSKFGAELSNFLGSLIINVILREISRQGEEDNADRVPVLLIIDEFQTYTGVPWQELLAQLRKWGGRTVLGTQSFASMISEDSKQLPEIIMSGVYSIVTFTVNGEDAEYLSKNEFSAQYGGPSQNTLISLAPHTCYARFLREDDVLSRPFFFTSTKPFEIDEDIQKQVYANRANYSLTRSEAVAGAVKYMSRMETVLTLQTGKNPGDNNDTTKITPPEENGYVDNPNPVESSEIKKSKEKPLEPSENNVEKPEEPEIKDTDFSGISIDIGEM